MPTLSISAALLVLGSSDALPWLSATWQTMTRIIGPPWETPPEAPPDSRAPNLKEWTVGMAQSVKAYAQNLWGKSPAEQINYSARGYTDNDSAGRTTWNEWVQGSIRRWKLNATVDEVFAECKVTAQEAMHRAKSKTLPSLETAQVFTMVSTPLASRLFGDDAFEDGLFLRPAIKNFIDALIVQTWHRYRKGVKRDEKNITKNRIKLDAAWTEITEKGSKIPIKTLRSYLELIRKQLTLLQRFEDKASTEEVENMQLRLKALLAEAQNDDSNKELRDTLPKVLREALKKLATPQDVREIQHLIEVALEHVNTDENSAPVELPDGRELDMGWKEGVEDLAHLTEEELWSFLGFPDKCLPFFQQYTDPNAVVEPWSVDGEKWLADPKSPREPLRPRWHQLVGIFRMLQRAFNGEPVLLMDGVGIGKTFQVIGTIACLAHYQWHYAKNGKFPGYFADKSWQGTDGNIPSLPFVISCPVNLHSQWTRELERFLKRKSFDILPYTGKLATRGDWWDKIFGQCQHPLHHRIILATESAIQDDSAIMFVDVMRDVDAEPKKSPAYTSRGSRTIFGRRYLSAIIDEAHSGRKFNKIHTAFNALRRQSCSVVAMTATPVMTKLQDLWIMGSMLGIKEFASSTRFKEMTKEMNRAQAKDRKTERESDEAGDRLRALLAGEEVEQVSSSSELAPKLRQWIPRIRDAFASFIIRRTLDSVDHMGNKIFGLPPFHEHVLLLELRDWEKERFGQITEELIDQRPQTTLAGAGKNFYIEVRRGLMHPHMNPGGDSDNCWTTPESLEDWKENRASTKMDVLMEIVAHHLARDDAPPLRIREDGQTLEEVPVEHPGEDTQVNEQGQDEGSRSLAKREPDRIIIFSLFPSSNTPLLEVLQLKGIKALELNGKTPPQKRRQILEEFRASTREVGSRVLILSQVGTVGLNLACANIMIIADTLWSALDDEQLRGRIYRFPQSKEVHFYRLIARGTPDVFLNNIAFDKGMLHQAFVGIDNHSLQLFEGKDEDHNTMETDSDSDSDSDDAMLVDESFVPAPKTRTKRGTKKARAQEEQAPLSPTRPSTKRPAPTSPLSPQNPARPQRKKQKEPKQPKQPKPKQTKGKGKAKAKAAGEGKTADAAIAAEQSSSSRAVIPLAVPIATVSAPPVLINPAAAVPVPALAQPVQATPQDVDDDVFMADVRPTAGNEPAYDPSKDPLLKEMLEDPNYQKDPEELEQMALMNLTSSSPLTSPPDSPTQMQHSTQFHDGVKTRTRGQQDSQPVAGPSTHRQPDPESISGVALIPGGKGQFKANTKTKGGRRGRN